MILVGSNLNCLIFLYWQ